MPLLYNVRNGPICNRNYVKTLTGNMCYRLLCHLSVGELPRNHIQPGTKCLCYVVYIISRFYFHKLFTRILDRQGRKSVKNILKSWLMLIFLCVGLILISLYCRNNFLLILFLSGSLPIDIYFVDEIKMYFRKTIEYEL